jgi:hypothetical protein
MYRLHDVPQPKRSHKNCFETYAILLRLMAQNPLGTQVAWRWIIGHAIACDGPCEKAEAFQLTSGWR